jgi:hypothetical protein
MNFGKCKFYDAKKCGFENGKEEGEELWVRETRCK